MSGMFLLKLLTLCGFIKEIILTFIKYNNSSVLSQRKLFIGNIVLLYLLEKAAVSSIVFFLILKRKFYNNINGL